MTKFYNHYILYIVIINLALNSFHLAVDGEYLTTKSELENGRYLVYPTPGTFAPTKVQLIVGLGLPMEVDVSMIVGYVTKFNYVLPYNASYLHSGYDSIRYDRSIDPRSIYREAEIPISMDQEEVESISDNVERWSSRWKIYRLIESVLDSFEITGKSCLLKIVCQVAEVPFENSRAGLVAQLIHLLLTPSTTYWEKYHDNGDQEYHSAEVIGKNNPGKCENIFHECQYNLLDYFTDIIQY